MFFGSTYLRDHFSSPKNKILGLKKNQFDLFVTQSHHMASEDLYTSTYNYATTIRMQSFSAGFCNFVISSLK